LATARFRQWNEYFATILSPPWQTKIWYYEHDVVLRICPNITLLLLAAKRRGQRGGRRYHQAMSNTITINSENIVLECNGCVVDICGGTCHFGDSSSPMSVTKEDFCLFPRRQLATTTVDPIDDVVASIMLKLMSPAMNSSQGLTICSGEVTDTPFGRLDLSSLILVLLLFSLDGHCSWSSTLWKSNKLHQSSGKIDKGNAICDCLDSECKLYHSVLVP